MNRPNLLISLALVVALGISGIPAPAWAIVEYKKGTHEVIPEANPQGPEQANRAIEVKNAVWEVGGIKPEPLVHEDFELAEDEIDETLHPTSTPDDHCSLTEEAADSETIAEIKDEIVEPQPSDNTNKLPIKGGSLDARKLVEEFLKAVPPVSKLIPNGIEIRSNLGSKWIIFQKAGVYNDQSVHGPSVEVVDAQSQGSFAFWKYGLMSAIVTTIATLITDGSKESLKEGVESFITGAVIGEIYEGLFVDKKSKFVETLFHEILGHASESSQGPWGWNPWLVLFDTAKETGKGFPSRYGKTDPLEFRAEWARKYGKNTEKAYCDAQKEAIKGNAVPLQALHLIAELLAHKGEDGREYTHVYKIGRGGKISWREVPVVRDETGRIKEIQF